MKVPGGRVPDRIVGIRPAFQEREASTGTMIALQVICVLVVLQALVWAAHGVWCGEVWLAQLVRGWF